MDYTFSSGKLQTGVVKIPLFEDSNIILLDGMYHIYTKINNEWVTPPFSHTIIKENNIIYLIALYTENGLSTEYEYLFVYPELTQADLNVPANSKKSKKVQVHTEIKPIVNPPPAWSNLGDNKKNQNN